MTTKDDSHLRSEFEMKVDEALRIDTLYVMDSFVDAIIERAKGEGGFNEEYLKRAFLTLVTVPPRPIPEEIEKVFSRPHGEKWKVEIKSMIGHWLLAEFLIQHYSVSAAEIEGEMVLNCQVCQAKLKVPMRRIPHAPTYFKLNLEGCNERD